MFLIIYGECGDMQSLKFIFVTLVPADCMIKPLSIFINLFLFFFFVNYSSKAQTMLPDSTSGFIGKAYTEYTAAVQEQMELFNGREHVDYFYKFDKGSPYFLAGNFTKGDVTYLNKTYKDVSLTYDVVKDEVAILHSNILKRLIPDKLKLDAFTINGHHFIKLSPGITNYKSLPGGYYDLLYNDKISLLAKRTKKIVDLTPETRVYSKDLFYISKNNLHVPCR